MIEEYSIHEHSHRFFAWAASRAASTSPVCRFEVILGVKALEACGFNGSYTIELLPARNQFNDVHKAWRKTVIDSISVEGKSPTHGIAAKLINTYLKGRFVCGGYHEHDKAKTLHPPIDSVLLKELKTKNVGGYKSEWRKLEIKGWSNFSSSEYERAIHLIRDVSCEDPLWMIEKYWRGYR